MSTWEDGTLRCTNCGREVRAHRDHCPYCKALLYPVPGAVGPYAEGEIIRPAGAAE